MARLVGALGGRAAEEIIFGDAEVTTGASGDLQQVCLQTVPVQLLQLLNWHTCCARRSLLALPMTELYLMGLLLEGSGCT